MEREVETVEVHIAMGLPGSGKTTWMNAESNRVKWGNPDSDPYDLYKQIKHESWYIDLDRIMWDKSHKDRVMSNGKLDMKKLLSYCTCLGTTRGVDGPIYVWIDGLALTRDDVLLYMRGLSDLVDPAKNMYIGGPMPFRWDIVVDQWLEDREQCIVNDKLRAGKRLYRSDITIKSADYEIVNEEDLMSVVLDENLHINDVKVEYHEVPKATSWQIDLDRKGDPAVAKYLKSKEWSLGGTWANYLGSHGYVERDEALDNECLYEILEKIVPDLKYLHYKRIEKECVKLVTRTDSDPYGGSVKYAHWETDLEKMYNLLKELGYKIERIQHK